MRNLDPHISGDRAPVMATVVMADDGIAFDGVMAEEGPLGGAETAFAALAEALARRGHEVGVWNHCHPALSHNGVSGAPVAGGGPTACELYICNHGHPAVRLGRQAR